MYTIHDWWTKYVFRVWHARREINFLRENHCIIIIIQHRCKSSLAENNNADRRAGFNDVIISRPLLYYLYIFIMNGFTDGNGGTSLLATLTSAILPSRCQRRSPRGATGLITSFQDTLSIPGAAGNTVCTV